MAKGPLVTPDVEVLIASVYKGHPSWKASMVRNEVDYLLHKQAPALPKGWPGLSAVQRTLARIRKSMSGIAPQDKPWSMDTLNAFPISPGAVPAVFKVWKFRIEKGDTLTIREAKWAALLSGLLEDTERLSHKALQYARTETLFELTGFPFDSTELDRSLLGLPVKLTTDSKSFLWLLAETREDTEKGIKDGIEQVREAAKGKKGGKAK